MTRFETSDLFRACIERELANHPALETAEDVHEELGLVIRQIQAIQLWFERR